jgi:hypothetical protein
MNRVKKSRSILAERIRREVHLFKMDFSYKYEANGDTNQEQKT